MILSIIVAASENHVIGHNNSLIWHLPADLKHFKTLTTGHSIIMGRKTYESMGRALPNRRNIVITHQSDFLAPGCELYPNLTDALAATQNEDEVFIIGGGILYRSLWNQADRLYLTRVHTEVPGETTIPAVDPTHWKEVKREDFNADEKNEYAYSFIEYRKIQ